MDLLCEHVLHVLYGYMGIVCICCVYLLCGYVMWIHVVFVCKDKDECSTVNCHQCIQILVISNISGCVLNLMYLFS